MSELEEEQEEKSPKKFFQLTYLGSQTMVQPHFWAPSHGKQAEWL